MDSKHYPWLVGLLLLLCPPAFLIHLGLSAFNGDEAIRTLVALEMDLSGNFIATTMHGADYINKPPLFNWLIWGMSKLWGNFGEWPSRLTTVTLLGLFGLIHYRILRWEFERGPAFLGTMMLLTSGRFLFYDALLGLIDTGFSLIIYLLFMSLYRNGKAANWRAFFAHSYAWMAIGFLLKGFPAIVFQGLSVLAALWFFGQVRRLFSWAHLRGIFLAAAILGAYLAVLSFYRPLDVFLSNLLHESTKRTVIAYDWGRFWAHLVKFPLESQYHFLPWSLLLLFWFQRSFRTALQGQPFIAFNFLILVVNLPIYWTSVQVLPRYLLMFIPLFNTIGLYFLAQNAQQPSWVWRIIYGFWGGLLVLGALGALGLPWIAAVNYLPGIGLIAAGLALGLGAAAWVYWRWPQYYLWAFIAGLLVLRIGFNLVVLPARHDESIITQARRDVQALPGRFPGRTWWVFGDAYIREPTSFYLTQKLGYIVRRTHDPHLPGAIYLVNPEEVPFFPGKCVDTLQTDYRRMQHLIYLPYEQQSR